MEKKYVKEYAHFHPLSSPVFYVSHTVQSSQTHLDPSGLDLLTSCRNKTAGVRLADFIADYETFTEQIRVCKNVCPAHFNVLNYLLLLLFDLLFRIKMEYTAHTSRISNLKCENPLKISNHFITD